MTPIIVIEEHDATRHILARYCQKGGYALIATATISAAPFLLAKTPDPCIVLIAVHPPGLAGRGLLCMLAQANPAYQRHRVIVLADEPLAGLHRHVTALRATLLVKPLDFALIDHTIDAHNLT